jgi:hypothetical protein
MRARYLDVTQEGLVIHAGSAASVHRTSTRDPIRRAEQHVPLLLRCFVRIEDRDRKR